MTFSSFIAELRSFNTPRSRRLLLLVLLIFVAGSLAMKRISTPPPDAPHADKGDDGLVLHLFELGGTLALLLALIHALRHWEREEVLIFFLSCFLYALLFEDMNIALSEDYAYNKEAWLLLHNTMLVIVFAWCAIAYTLVFILNDNPALRSWNPVEKGVVAGLLALTIDLGIDATAFAYGLWYWKGGHFFGVPITNFVGWFAAIFWFVFSTEYLKQKGKDWEFKKRLTARVLSIFPNYGGLLLIIGLSFAFLAAVRVI